MINDFDEGAVSHNPEGRQITLEMMMIMMIRTIVMIMMIITLAPLQS